MSEPTYEVITVIGEEVKPETTLKQYQEVKQDLNQELNQENNIIIDILESIIKNENISSIQLSKKEIDIINIIISNNSSLLQDINNKILVIIKDGRIDASDVPVILQFIHEFYIFCHQENKIKIHRKQLVETIGHIIKYIIHIILHKNKLDTPELLTCCDNLIDISMEIIELQSSLKSKGCSLFNCL
jgi:hemerythrin-like domain-containing protein